MNFISRNLRHLRTLRGLSQDGLAKEIGLNRGNIASYEKGTAEPNATRLLLIARYFQVSLVDLIARDLALEAPENYIERPAPSTDEVNDLTTTLSSSKRIIEGMAELQQLRLASDNLSSIDHQALLYDHERLLHAAKRLSFTADRLLQLMKQ